MSLKRLTMLLTFLLLIAATPRGWAAGEMSFDRDLLGAGDMDSFELDQGGEADMDALEADLAGDGAEQGDGSGDSETTGLDGDGPDDDSARDGGTDGDVHSEASEDSSSANNGSLVTGGDADGEKLQGHYQEVCRTTCACQNTLTARLSWGSVAVALLLASWWAKRRRRLSGPSRHNE